MRGVELPEHCLFEGQVIRASLRNDGEQRLEVELAEHPEAILLLPPSGVTHVRPGQIIYAICHPLSTERFTVLAMLYGEPGRMPQSQKDGVFRQVGLKPGSLPPMLSFAERVFRSGTERIEVEYLDAVRRGLADPVITLDTRNQAERVARAEARGVPTDGLPKVQLTIKIGTREQAVQEVEGLDASAAETVGRGADPDYPFTVVVITDWRVAVFHRKAPG